MSSSAEAPVFEDAGPVADLRAGSPVIVKVGGRELALVRMGETVYAVRNVCPHQTQSFAGGRAQSRVEGASTIGELDLLEDDPALACPWHGFEFRLRDGRCLVNPSLRVRTYPVEVRDGRVYVDLRGRLEDTD
jgi:nitrite reductase/ring-hydroxylating ferredoxin subunit